MDGGAGATMLDGTPVPPLPLTRPRQVRFGVVLVSYAGAQPSAAGGSRPADALARPTRCALAAEAPARPRSRTSTPRCSRATAARPTTWVASSWASSSRRPSTCSSRWASTAVGGPVDTPRGYWIVKRLE